MTVDVAPAFHDELLDLRGTSVWHDADVSGMPASETEVVSIGGGLASFALVDTLRVVGVDTAAIRVVSPQSNPVDAFRHLARVSQISDHDRLRSDSSARVDNVWGFPGYALEESVARRSLRPLWRVLTEPVGSEFFTPVSSHVYHGATNEATRIGWPQMRVRGRVEMVRPRAGGGFFTIVRDDGRCCSVIRSRYVHLGLGYPALRLTAELQRYRSQHGDGFSAVNAYEPHDHVYDVLARTGGTVLLRGAGITASRVIERLIDLRQATGQDIRIVHLVRHLGSGSSVDGRRKDLRPATTAWNHQAFNFPKAALGGQLADQLARVDDDHERATLIATLGRTTTPLRGRWFRQLRAAEATGAYRLVVGTLEHLAPVPGAGLRASISSTGAGGDPDAPAGVVGADFLIDCTGMHADAMAHPVLADLVAAGLGRCNSVGRIQVDANFEVREARNGEARLFTTGAMAFGSRVGPVDSFWGLNQSALQVCDELARLGFCPRLNVARSVRGWWRWIRGRRP